MKTIETFADLYKQDVKVGEVIKVGNEIGRYTNKLSLITKGGLFECDLTIREGKLVTTNLREYLEERK